MYCSVEGIYKTFARRPWCVKQTSDRLIRANLLCHCAKGIYSADAGEIIAAYHSSQSNLLSQATQNNYTKRIKKGAYLSDTLLGKRTLLLIVSYVQEPSAPVHYCTCLVQMSKIEEMYTFIHKYPILSLDVASREIQKINTCS